LVAYRGGRRLGADEGRRPAPRLRGGHLGRSLVVDAFPQDEAVRQGLKALSNWPTYPQARAAAGRACRAGPAVHCACAAPFCGCWRRVAPCTPLPTCWARVPLLTGVRPGGAAGWLRHHHADEGGGRVEAGSGGDAAPHARCLEGPAEHRSSERSYSCQSKRVAWQRQLWTRAADVIIKLVIVRYAKQPAVPAGGPD